VGVPLIGCDVTITNVRLGVSVSVVSSSLGKFMYNLASMGEENQYADGDLITVEAELGELSGEAEGYVDTSGQLTMINVTLTTAIPEFSMVIVPVVGMMALFVIVGLRKRNART
jgi:fructose/tagatose bisphosphate aldolase